jgi:hypothetical protein
LMTTYIVTATTLSLGTRYAHHWYVLFVYAAAYLVVRYGLSALYLINRPRVSAGRKLFLWAVGTPAAVLLNIILLIPTRYVALGKLFDNRWQTRELSAEELRAAAAQANSLVPGRRTAVNVGSIAEGLPQ